MTSIDKKDLTVALRLCKAHNHGKQAQSDAHE